MLRRTPANAPNRLRGIPISPAPFRKALPATLSLRFLQTVTPGEAASGVSHFRNVALVYFRACQRTTVTLWGTGGVRRRRRLGACPTLGQSILHRPAKLEDGIQARDPETLAHVSLRPRHPQILPHILTCS